MINKLELSLAEVSNQVRLFPFPIHFQREKYASDIDKLEKAIRALEEKKKDLETQRHDRIKVQNNVRALKREVSIIIGIS